MTERLTAAQAADRLGIPASTFRAYVSRGQAPQRDGRDEDTGRPYWLAATIDEYKLTRPGQGARTDRRRAMTKTYTAAVATDPSCVAGDYCDVQVLENEIVTYRIDDDGNEIPEYGMTSVLALDAIETDVRTDDEDALDKAQRSADEILAEHGWRRTEEWSVADTAMYALAERY